MNPVGVSRPEGPQAIYLLVEIGTLAAAEVSCDLSLAPYNVGSAESGAEVEELLAAESASRGANAVILIFRASDREDAGNRRHGNNAGAGADEKPPVRVLGYGMALTGPVSRRDVNAYCDVPAIIRGEQVVRVGWIRSAGGTKLTLATIAEDQQMAALSGAMQQGMYLSEADVQHVGACASWSRLQGRVGAILCDSIDVAFQGGLINERGARGGMAPGAGGLARGAGRGGGFMGGMPGGFMPRGRGFFPRGGPIGMHHHHHHGGMMMAPHHHHHHRGFHQHHHAHHHHHHHAMMGIPPQFQFHQHHHHMMAAPGPMMGMMGGPHHHHHMFAPPPMMMHHHHQMMMPPPHHHHHHHAGMTMPQPAPVVGGAAAAAAAYFAAQQPMGAMEHHQQAPPQQQQMIEEELPPL